MKTILSFLSSIPSLPISQKLCGRRLIFFALFAIATLAVPLGIIARYENVRSNGAVHKLRVAPVDPQDPLRGRYVRLHFADEKVLVSKKLGEIFWREEKSLAYVRLKKDAAGFSVPAEFSWEPFKGDGTNYITVDRFYLSYGRREAEDKEVSLHYPFNRYYLPEQIAPEAENAYFASVRNNPNSGNVADDKRGVTYVTVRVLGGKAVLEELYINGVPVREAVRNANKAK
jgi:uncharacterized membrane-anchored protein